MGIRQLIRSPIVLLAVAGCSQAEQPALPAFEVSGHLEDRAILEASGLARSQRQPDLLWIINDRGAKEIVHAVDHTGRRLGEFDLKKAKNRDWEDLGSFRLDDTPYLMIADIGDNNAKRDTRRLYFTEEPEPETDGKSRIAWEVEYRYPDGPRDAESAAVDLENRRVLVLSKRDLPPQLYAVPLDSANDGEVVTATALGNVLSLNRPTREEVQFAPKTKSWFWQPVGMDISSDGLAAVILTYSDVYYYQRRPDEDWPAALNSTPLRISLGGFENAESIAFGDDARSVFVTGENKHAAILHVDLQGAGEL